MAELDDPRRLAEFRAPLLCLDHDPVLDACVSEAAERARAPMALVSFVMRRVHLLKAAVGLSPELQATRAASRSESYCHFVVTSEAPVIVENARRDGRLPRHLAETCCMTAYAGVPIRARGQILGAVAVADCNARPWSANVIRDLEALSDEVSARLDAIISAAESCDEFTVVPPASLAARACVLAGSLHRSLVEVAPMIRLARSVDGLPADRLASVGRTLAEVGDFYEELLVVAAELRVATERVEHSVAVRRSSSRV